MRALTALIPAWGTELTELGLAVSSL